MALEKNGQKVREIGEGNAFGTVAALDLNPALHTVKAVDYVHALKLDARDLHDLLSQDIELVEGVIRVLCRMIRAASDHRGSRFIAASRLSKKFLAPLRFFSFSPFSTGFFSILRRSVLFI